MHRIPRLPAVAAIAALVACSDAFKPTTENVLGDYTAQSFTATDTSGTIDWIQRGGTLSIALGPSGVMTGHLFLPGAAAGGGDLDTILIGDWILTGNTITFDMPAIDTFVRDMAWTAGKDRLSGDHMFGVTRLKVVLMK